MLVWLVLIVMGGLTSLFFDWIFVFAISVLICMVSLGVVLAGRGDWWVLGKVWLAIALFHLSYFTIGFLAFNLRYGLARRERNAKQFADQQKSKSKAR